MSFATEIAKERFYDQMERYRNLNDSLDLPAGVLPLYFGALLFFADRLVAFWPAAWKLGHIVIAYSIFGLATVATGIFVVWAAWGYCRTIWCYQDATDLPSPKAVDDWLRETQAVLSCSEEELESRCEPGLREDYITAAEATFRQNEARSRRMFYCRRHLVVSLLLTGLSMACYSWVNGLQTTVGRPDASKTALATAEPSTAIGNESAGSSKTPASASASPATPHY